MKEWIQILEWICLLSVLIYAVITDLRTGKIKNLQNVLGALAGLFISLIPGGRTPLDSIQGFLVLLVVGLILWNFKVFAAGDAKLLCVIGAFQGWKLGIASLAGGIVVGAIIGIPFLIRRLVRKEKGFTRYPFAISLFFGSLIANVLGPVLNIFPLD